MIMNLHSITEFNHSENEGKNNNNSNKTQKERRKNACILIPDDDDDFFLALISLGASLPVKTEASSVHRLTCLLLHRCMHVELRQPGL